MVVSSLDFNVQIPYTGDLLVSCFWSLYSLVLLIPVSFTMALWSSSNSFCLFVCCFIFSLVQATRLSLSPESQTGVMETHSLGGVSIGHILQSSFLLRDKLGCKFSNFQLFQSSECSPVQTVSFILSDTWASRVSWFCQCLWNPVSEAAPSKIQNAEWVL